MKKLLFILAIIAMTTPIMAQSVDFVVTDLGGQKVQIGYTNNGVPAADLPVGIALKVVVSGCEITGLVSYDQVEFPAYIDYAYSEETVGDGYDPLGEGQPLAENEDTPGRLDEAALGVGNDVTTVYICMGRVQDATIVPPNGVAGPNPGPATVVNLVTLLLDIPGSEGLVSVYEDSSSRGGVVGGGDPFATNLPQEDVPIAGGCFPSAHPDYAEWVAAGSPKCWCCPQQCHGDAGLGQDSEDCDIQGSSKDGYYLVGANDLTVLLNAWKVLEATFGPGISSVPNGICADFAHDQQGSTKDGFYRVGANDLTILLNGWKVLEPTFGPGTPGDCLD